MSETRRPAANSRSLAGFTLVELLVVVAIISVLAGMLLPALEKALAAARAMDCASNCRQLFLGVEAYADANADWLPIGSENGGWRVEILPYIEPSACKIVETYATEYLRSSYVAQKIPVYVCKSTLPALRKYGTVSGIGWNYKYLGYLDTSSTSPRIRRQAVSKPSQTLMMGDSADDIDPAKPWLAVHIYEPGVSFVLPCPGPGNRHGNGINAGFADGHVQWYLRGWLLDHGELYRLNK